MQTQLNRRSFLKAGAAGLLILPSGTVFGQNRPSNRLNIALIGAWGRASQHYGALKGENVVVVCDVHKKNLAKLNPDLEAYEAAKAEMGEDFYRDHNSLAYGGEGFQPSEDKVEGMVQNLLDAAERRNKFSRRRPEVFEANVDSINDRNKHFNKKIERAFGAAHRAAFHVSDGLEGFAPASVDLVLCNPPFHQQHAVGDQIAKRFFRQVHTVLRPGGELWVIGNRHWGYHVTLKRLFGNANVVASNAKFVILGAVRRSS